MPIELSGKLEKLRIEAFKDALKSAPLGEPFEVMFNPTTLTVQHTNVYKGPNVIGGHSVSKTYAYTKSQTIDLDIILDGSGVTSSGLSNLLGGTKSVAERVKAFLELCFYQDGNIHEPKYLHIKWGKGPLKGFNCKLVSAGIEYTSFEKDGSPRRATIKCKFEEYVDSEGGARNARKSSPDLTHRRTVRSGDTLPLLSKEIYGSSAYYLQLAKVNNLTNFRNLIPGTELVFPPLEK